jgi:hypothetical protein
VTEHIPLAEADSLPEGAKVTGVVLDLRGLRARRGLRLTPTALVVEDELPICGEG